jgi:universal stress protein A
MKRFLVALDTSDNSTFVLARAIELASGLGAKIRLVAAVQMPLIVSARPAFPSYMDPSAITGLAEATLRERERDVPEALRDGVVVEIGLASDVICSVARSYDADLVIIGAHRHGLLARMLGTTAATIVNHIDRPVIVVRPTPTQLEASRPEPVASNAPLSSPGRTHDRHPLLETATLAGAGALLRRDHERLEETYEDLLAAYRSGDWEQVRAQWDLFEPAIRAHMDTEEHDVFPELRAVDHEEADALLADHAELRRLLGTLGVAVDLHAVPAADAQELIARLRAHGAREEALLYPWMDRAFDAQKLRRLSPAA